VLLEISRQEASHGTNRRTDRWRLTGNSASISTACAGEAGAGEGAAGEIGDGRAALLDMNNVRYLTRRTSAHGLRIK